MSTNIPLFRIFLSSPGDVAAERQIAREIIEALNDNTFIKGMVRIDPLAWEDPGSRVLMPVSLTPQQAIDRNMARPSETEAVIVILWGRMGTPLDPEKHGTKEDGEPYWSGTEWEFMEAQAGAAKHPQNLPIILVYRRMDTPPYPEDDDLDAHEQWVIQRKRVKAFFDQFRDSESGAYRASINEYHSQDEFRTIFTKDAELLVKELIALCQNVAPLVEPDEKEAHITWKGSPFPGLRAFSEKDEPIFFGRGYETADLIKRFSKHRLMFVIGASGSGKSSLVGAGILPQIRRGALYGVAGWHIVRFTPGNAPFMRLSYALLRTIPALDDPIADDDERAEKISAILRKEPDKLAQQIEKWLAREPDGTEVLLFIDQFEELFTTAPDDQRVEFTAMLRKTSPHLRIITTMRSDFYDRALVYFETILRDASYTLGTPSPIALYEMITRPAQVTGLHFDEGLAEEIVEKTTGQVGGLALVAYLLEELYLRAEKRGDGKLTYVDYDGLGGVEKAIAVRAETIYRDEIELPAERKKAALQRVFHELVEPIIREGEVVATRRRVPYAHFENDKDAQWLIKAFTKARLLVRDEGMLEVAHEALLREWGELAAWITSIADDLRLLRQYERDANDWFKRGAKPDALFLCKQSGFLFFPANRRHFYSSLQYFSKHINMSWA